MFLRGGGERERERREERGRERGGRKVRESDAVYHIKESEIKNTKY